MFSKLHRLMSKTPTCMCHSQLSCYNVHLLCVFVTPPHRLLARIMHPFVTSTSLGLLHFMFLAWCETLLHYWRFKLVQGCQIRHLVEIHFLSKFLAHKISLLHAYSNKKYLIIPFSHGYWILPKLLLHPWSCFIRLSKRRQTMYSLFIF